MIVNENKAICEENLAPIRNADLTKTDAKDGHNAKGLGSFISELAPETLNLLTDDNIGDVFSTYTQRIRNVQSCSLKVVLDQSEIENVNSTGNQNINKSSNRSNGCLTSMTFKESMTDQPTYQRTSQPTHMRVHREVTHRQCRMLLCSFIQRVHLFSPAPV